VDEACGVIGDLLAQLRSPACRRSPRFTAYAVRQLAKPPPSTCCRGGSSSRVAGSPPSSVTDPDVDAWLLHTDLHYENVLRGTRQPWLAIDPKPTAGDRAFEVAPALWNRRTSSAPGRRSAGTCAAVSRSSASTRSIDEDRAKAWTIVREVDNATDPAEGPAGPVSPWRSSRR
jgi:streptomycin 6-kinase